LGVFHKTSIAKIDIILAASILVILLSKCAVVIGHLLVICLVNARWNAAVISLVYGESETSQLVAAACPVCTGEAQQL